MLNAVGIKRTYRVECVAELKPILEGDLNGDGGAFWLNHDSDEFPVLGIILKGNLAYLCYLPRDQDAGFASVGTVQDLPRGQTTRFRMSSSEAEDIFVVNEAVVALSSAVLAAGEFLFSKDLPLCIAWTKL